MEIWMLKISLIAFYIYISTSNTNSIEKQSLLYKMHTVYIYLSIPSVRNFSVQHGIFTRCTEKKLYGIVRKSLESFGILHNFRPFIQSPHLVPPCKNILFQWQNRRMEHVKSTSGRSMGWSVRAYGYVASALFEFRSCGWIYSLFAWDKRTSRTRFFFN